MCCLTFASTNHAGINEEGCAYVAACERKGSWVLWNFNFDKKQQYARCYEPAQWRYNCHESLCTEYYYVKIDF